MANFNLFIVRPCGDADQGQRWQVVHQQSGAHTLAPSAAAAANWLAGRAEIAPQLAPAATPASADVRWSAGTAVELR